MPPTGTLMLSSARKTAAAANQPMAERRPDPVGDPAGDEQADHRADVQHQQERQRGTEVVAGDPHDLRQPGVQPVDEQQTHEGRDPDGDAVRR